MRIGIIVNDSNVKWPWIHMAAQASGHDCKRILANDLVDADAKWADLILFAQYGHGIGLGLPMRTGLIDTSGKWPAAGAQPKAGTGPQPHRALWAVWCFDTFLLHPDKPIHRQPGLVSDGGIPTPYLNWLRRMDLVLCKDRGLFPDLTKLGIRPVYLDQACPGQMIACEHAEKPEWDVLVYGNVAPGWHHRRQAIANLLEAGFSVAVASRWGEAQIPGVVALPYCEPLDLPVLAGRSAVTLVADFTSAIDGYSSDRGWLALGMGAAVVRRKSAGLPTREDGTLPYLTYDSRDELIAAVLSLKTDVNKRRDLGTQARAWVQGAHLYEHRINELVSIVETRRGACKAPTKHAEPVAAEAQ